MNSDVIVVLFTLANALRVFAYLPQILTLARDDTGAVNVSCSTWSLFFLAHITTVAYVLFEKHDVMLAVVFALNATCCATIVGLVIWRRQAYLQSRVKQMETTRTT